MLILLCACSTQEPALDAPATPEPPVVQDAAAEARAIAEANDSLNELGKSLKGRMVEVLREGGPTAAVGVCSTEAQALTAAISAESGGQAGRASTKLRNPDNAGPAWVREWLEQADSDTPGVSEIIDGQACVLKPILIEPGCLACHGSHIDDEVAALLAERYPEDAATGYGVGDLRGAMWAEVPVQR